METYFSTHVFFPENVMPTHHRQLISYIIKLHSFIHSLSISISIISRKLHHFIYWTISDTITQSIMRKDISIGHTYQIASHIQSIKQQSKVLTCYCLTSLLKSGQLIKSSQDK